MNCHARRCVVGLLALALSTVAVAQEGNAQIKGRVVREGAGVGGAIVVLVELTRSEVTHADGNFEFDKLAAGSYTLIVSRGDDTLTRPEVVVAPGATVRVLLEVDWTPGVSESITVTAGARADGLNEFMFGGGPSRLFLATLTPDGPDAVQIIPGGESGNLGSPNRTDQLGLWLVNDYHPLPVALDDVLAIAVGTETYECGDGGVGPGRGVLRPQRQQRRRLQGQLSPRADHHVREPGGVRGSTDLRRCHRVRRHRDVHRHLGCRHRDLVRPGRAVRTRHLDGRGVV